MIRSMIIASSLLLASGVAFAGKAHREAAKGFAEKSKAAAADIKSGCGCAPALSADGKSFEAVTSDNVEDFRKNVEREFEELAKTAKAYCNDADSKKLFCGNVKKIVVFSKGLSETDTKYDKGSKTFSVYTSKDMNSGGYKMKSIMDEW